MGARATPCRVPPGVALAPAVSRGPAVAYRGAAVGPVPRGAPALTRVGGGTRGEACEVCGAHRSAMDVPCRAAPCPCGRASWSLPSRGRASRWSAAGVGCRGACRPGPRGGRRVPWCGVSFSGGGWDRGVLGGGRPPGGGGGHRWRWRGVTVCQGCCRGPAVGRQVCRVWPGPGTDRGDGLRRARSPSASPSPHPSVAGRHALGCPQAVDGLLRPGPVHGKPVPRAGAPGWTGESVPCAGPAPWPRLDRLPRRRLAAVAGAVTQGGRCDVRSRGHRLGGAGRGRPGARTGRGCPGGVVARCRAHHPAHPGGGVRPGARPE